GPCRFFLSCHGGPPGRPSFPTRRSSDLDVRFEPGSALVAGEDGLDDIRHIIVQAPAHLQSAGWLLLEHGYDQAEAVRTLLSEGRSEEHTSELQSRENLVCRPLLEKKNSA